MRNEKFKKSSARVNWFAKLGLHPRFAYPEMAEVVDATGEADQSALSGVFSVAPPEELLTAVPMDTIGLPAGTPVRYIYHDALVFYSLQPANSISEFSA